MYEENDIKQLLCITEHQLNSFWKTDFNSFANIAVLAECAYKNTLKCLSSSANIYFELNGFSPYNSVHYALYLYYLGHEIGVNAESKDQIQLADKVYYLNKIMNCVDWYWAIDLPEHFFVEHPIGTVLGRAKYGDYLFVYQGVTVGGNYHNGNLDYPYFSDYTVLYANATVLGNCKIGKNVVISANTYIINEVIPDNTIVFGTSPNLVLKPINERKRDEIFSTFWKKSSMD